MRRFDEPVAVRNPLTSAQDDVQAMQFVWRGRLWNVREVLSHWRETGAWWDSPAVRAARGDEDEPGGDFLAEAEIWRVYATSGRYGASGIYELAQSQRDGAWQLRAVVD